MEVFKNIPFGHIKRIIGFIDSDPGSATFGCADRYYWHYKLNDYANARFQECSLALAFFYLDKGSFLYSNQKLLELINGAILYWTKERHQNGSVDEIYPQEQSFCATAFGLYIITETIGLLKSDEAFNQNRNGLEKTGDWLLKNGNWHITNQIAASAAGLYNLGNLLQEKKYSDEARRRIEFLLAEFDKNGYFTEYGGFDLGYNTLTMSILARIYQKNNDNKILECLRKSEEKISVYLDEFGRYDNTGMSRHTQFIYPFAFKVLQSPIFSKIKQGIEKDLILNPDWLDDRYLIGLSNDYLMTCYY
jgi:hypothetical protein